MHGLLPATKFPRALSNIQEQAGINPRLGWGWFRRERWQRLPRLLFNGDNRSYAVFSARQHQSIRVKNTTQPTFIISPLIGGTQESLEVGVNQLRAARLFRKINDIFSVSSIDQICDATDEEDTRSNPSSFDFDEYLWVCRPMKHERRVFLLFRFRR